jgi:hypothetical protein
MVQLLNGADLKNKELINALLEASGTLDTAKQFGYNTTREELAWRTTGNADKTIRDVTLDKFAAPVADVSLGGFKITNLATPTNATDAATKAYADAISAGLDPKASVRMATTTTLDLSAGASTYSIASNTAGANNGVILTMTGGSGTAAIGDEITFSNAATGDLVWFDNATGSSTTRFAVRNLSGAVATGAFTSDGTFAGTVSAIQTTKDFITGDAVGASSAVDTVTPVAANRMLVKDESDAKQNGLYGWSSIGSASIPFLLERTDDQDGSPANEVSAGNHTFVEQGTANIGKGFTVIGNGTLTLNTDNISWTQFSSPGAYTAGVGLANTGNDFYVAQTGTTLTIGANALDVNLATNGGLEDVSGVKIKVDTTGGANLAEAINLSANGVAIKVDTTTITSNGSDQLAVNFGTNIAKWQEFTTVGGSATESFTHSLNNRDIFAFAREVNSPYNVVFPGVQATGLNTCTLDFGVDPSTNYRVVVMGLLKP